MKRSNLILAAASFVVGFNAFASDADADNSNVKVDWQSPEKYTDVRPANQSRKRFMEQTFHQFEEHFEELAEKFPDTYEWHITVTDVDLAGQVWPSSFVGLGQGGQDVRLIKDIEIPRMTFSYELREGDSVIRAADVKLKDMGFMQRALRGFDSEPLRYEKRMLTDWFNDEFEQQVIAKQ